MVTRSLVLYRIELAFTCQMLANVLIFIISDRLIVISNRAEETVANY